MSEGDREARQTNDLVIFAAKALCAGMLAACASILVGYGVFLVLSEVFS